MKKTIAVFFILSLLIPLFGFSRAFADDAANRDQLVQDFSQIAMNEFKSMNNTQMNYTEVNSKVDDYSQKFAAILLNSKVDPKISGIIMQKTAAWYGQALEELFNGKDYNPVIQDYSAKIADLFSQQHLNLDAQSKIVDMTSDNLESLNTLFKGLEEVGD